MSVWTAALLALAGLKVTAGVAGGLLGGPGPAPFPLWVHLAVVLSFGGVGAALVLAGRPDRRAQDLGGVFVLVAALFADRWVPLTAGLLPATLTPVVAALAIVDPNAFRPWLVWRFAGAFPREASFGWRRRLAALGRRVSLAGGAVLFAASVALAAAAAWRAGGVPDALALLDRRGPWPIYWLVVTPLTLAALPLIVWNARTASLVEHRRVGVFVTGLVVGAGPMLAEALLEMLIPPFARFMSQPGVRQAAGLVLFPLLISVPFTTGYAVFVDQVLSVRLVVRRALRYALARATLVGLLAVPFTMLAWFLYENRDRPLASLLSGPAPFGLTSLVAAGLALLGARRRLFTMLDRRFFREQYDARRILTDLVEQSREATSVPALARLLTREIDRALHLDRAAVLALDSAGEHFVDPSGEVARLASQSALAALLAGGADPLDVQLEQPGAALGRLPEEERRWLADGAFRLLVPLRGAEKSLVGMIALGTKKSELPFSTEDRRLLSAIAASGSIAIENLRLRTPKPSGPAPRTERRAVSDSSAAARERQARECPRCLTVHGPDQTNCPLCEHALEPAPVPLAIRGAFLVERRLGAGGMGVVYRARDLHLGRLVAIKALPSVSPEHASRLRREARAMAAVQHGHVATIFGLEMWHGTPLIVVEYFAAGTLHERLAGGRSLDVREALELGAALAGGLERMHEAGILHRDIKPSNIGFTDAGVPKLLDFGLARFLVEARTGTLKGFPGLTPDEVGMRDDRSAGESALGLIGTPLYFSPETVQMKPPDVGVDLWALAMVVFEAIAGRHPMRAPALVDVLTRIATAELPDLRAVRPGCPEAVADFLRAALHRDPRRRPGSARELRLRFESLARDVAAGVT
jgi:hypothetical protein